MSTEIKTSRTDASFEQILRYSTRCSLSLRNHIAKAKESHSQLETELTAAHQANERLKAALVKYGDHSVDCNLYAGSLCMCGWSDILKQLEAK